MRSDERVQPNKTDALQRNTTQKITVREVGLRDGLQSIQTIVATERKLEWISAAYAAGQREIEVGSFVPARLPPQLANTLAALDVGVRKFDASLAGIDLDALLALRKRVATWLAGEQLGGSIWRAGVPKSGTTCRSGAAATTLAACARVAAAPLLQNSVK